MLKDSNRNQAFQTNSHLKQQKGPKCLIPPPCSTVLGGFTRGMPRFPSMDAVSALPSGLSNRLRFVVADGDNFRFFEAGREDKMGSGFRETKDSVDRKEGSGLETVKLLLSRDERYLYALNQGNNTVSAYNVSSSGILSYIGSSELPFCPADAILSPDGNHMIIEGTGNSELVIMRIKTTE